MSWLLICMVIFVTFAALMLGVGRLLKTGRAELDRLLALDQAAQAVARAELPRAGRFPVEYLPGPPFAGAADPAYETRGFISSNDGTQIERDPFNTGPLLLLSDKAAANVALEREVKAMIEAAEREIGPTP